MPKGVYTRRIRPVADRLWEHVDKNGPSPEHVQGLGQCWLWTGNINSSGYGVMFADGRKLRTHRISFVLANGPIDDEICVLHHCDVRRCLRPSHLFKGTRGDNLQDAIRKGRHRPPNPPGGERHSHAKLTEPAVAEIRRRYAEGGVYQRELAAEFGVNASVISDVVRGKLWRRL